MASTELPTTGQLPPEIDEILHSRDDLLICPTCGTQFATADPSQLTSCHICDDPRQYVPPTGQSWTTLKALRPSHSNTLSAHPSSSSLFTLLSTPQIGIGQRCFLLRTPTGNILWDCLTLLDFSTISSICALGGLAAIVISHPHFYTTHLLWAAVFACPVYLSSSDRAWLSQPDLAPRPARIFIDGAVLDIPGTDGRPTTAKAIKVGGHFPGSLVLLWDERLLVADTLMATPAGLGDWGARGRPDGMNSYVFMWSYPNSIPLPPPTLASMWKALAPHAFRATHGAFVGKDIEGPDTKRRVWESMLIQVRAEGYDAQRFIQEFGLVAPE